MQRWSLTVKFSRLSNTITKTLVTYVWDQIVWIGGQLQAKVVDRRLYSFLYWDFIEDKIAPLWATEVLDLEGHQETEALGHGLRAVNPQA
jgi:hypothetical protein